MVDIIKISTILDKPRDRVGFEEKIQTKAEATQRNFRQVIKNFDTFCSKQYKITCESLDFPHKISEEKYPLTKKEIKKILDVCSYNNRLRILAQTSSGLRRGELLQLQKKDLDMTRQRITVNVPAKITKTKKSRVTFFSKEVQRILIPRLKNLNDDDKVFSYSNIKLRNIGDSYQQAIVRYLKKIGLSQKYSVGNYKISTHSFRAFFITKVSRHDPNLAKYFAGQEQSRDLLMYDRLTLDERLEKYMEFEPDLLMYDTVKDYEGQAKTVKI